MVIIRGTPQEHVHYPNTLVGIEDAGSVVYNIHEALRT